MKTKILLALTAILLSTSLSAQPAENQNPDFIFKYDNQTVEIRPDVEFLEGRDLRVVRYTLLKTETFNSEIEDTSFRVACMDRSYCSDLINAMKEIRNGIVTGNASELSKSLGDFIVIAEKENNKIRLFYGGISLVISIQEADAIITAFEKSLQAISS